MIRVNSEEVLEQTKAYAKFLDKGASAPLFFQTFAGKTLTRIHEESGVEYPLYIKIPKPMKSLLKGDMEPIEVLKIDEPIMLDGVPIWFGDSSSGAYFRLGYLNGDSRYPCNLQLNDKDIHMLLAGATGHGKSVTLNAGIYMLCLEYGPWSLNLTMCDPKLVEFRKYTIDSLMPHISSIGATKDVDYILSVLEEKNQEMMDTMKVLAKVSTSNIASFRKKTGLCLPQNLIIIDEVKTLFVDSGKKLNRLLELIGSYTMLGRSAGYHLIMASQEFDSSMPANAMNQIGVRAALGCVPSVSEKIIGNKGAAANFGTKGRLIINTNINEGGMENNKTYYVPFLTDDDFGSYRAKLSAQADKAGYRRQLSFFDEDILYNQEEFKEVCNNYSSPNQILLGEPSFVMRDKGGVNFVKLLFDSKDVENVFVLGPNKLELIRLVRTILINMEVCGEGSVSSKILVGDQDLYDSVGFNESLHTQTRLKMYTDRSMLDMMYIVTLRRFLVFVDGLVRSNAFTTEESDAEFASIIQPNKRQDTKINRARFYYALQNIRNKDFERMLWSDFNKVGGELEQRDALTGLFSLIDHLNVNVDTITRGELPPQFVWVLGINKVIGLGRDVKDSYQEDFKKFMFDVNESNTRIIVASTSTEDLGKFKSAFKYFVMGAVPPSYVTRLGLSDDYPTNLGGNMCVLMEPTGERKVSKFKKLILPEEE